MGVYRINRSRHSVGRLYQRVGVAEIPWWLAGGIPAENCIAAYQPKGAASYAASKVNLANPGTYDAYEGTTLRFTLKAGSSAQLPIGEFKFGIQSIAEDGTVLEPYMGDWVIVPDYVRKAIVAGGGA